MLKLVGPSDRSVQDLDKKNIGVKPYQDHNQLLERYLQSHRTRNHSSKTIKREEAFLYSWFKLHGNENRSLYVWEAMKPIVGRKRVVDYAICLIDQEISNHTVRSYLGILNRYFSYVLEYPYLMDDTGKTERILDIYGPIEQPVSEYDMPVHVYNGEQRGVPFAPENLYGFYALLREKYLRPKKHYLTSARNYAMGVLAGESGLRIDELIHLTVDDLFFESKKVQTRHAKSTRGSGKRSRLTLFPSLSRDTVNFYLQKIRPHLLKEKESNILFLSRTGNMLNYSSMQVAMKQMARIANQNGFTVASHMGWHWMRRFFATLFIERFPDKLPVLITLLGHVTPNTVHAYIQHSQAWMDKQILELLERGF